MDGIRDIFKESLGKALQRLREEDRIAAAWTVACGRALAERSAVVGFDGGVLRVEVADGAWLGQFVSMRSQLQAQISRIAGVRVDGIHFEVKKF